MNNGPYTLVTAPNDYPGKKYRNKYVYEHHLIWWINTREIIDTKKEIIHHKNENKKDNNFLNLYKMSRINHTKHHSKSAKIAKLKCDWCNTVFERNARDIKSRTKSGYKHAFCSRSHQVSFQHKNKSTLSDSSTVAATPC